MLTVIPQPPEGAFAVINRKHLSYTQVPFRGFRGEHENKIRCDAKSV